MAAANGRGRDKPRNLNALQFTHHSHGSTKGFRYRKPETARNTRTLRMTHTEQGVQGHQWIGAHAGTAVSASHSIHHASGPHARK